MNRTNKRDNRTSSARNPKKEVSFSKFRKEKPAAKEYNDTTPGEYDSDKPKKRSFNSDSTPENKRRGRENSSDKRGFSTNSDKSRNSGYKEKSFGSKESGFSRKKSTDKKESGYPKRDSKYGKKESSFGRRSDSTHSSYPRKTENERFKSKKTENKSDFDLELDWNTLMSDDSTKPEIKERYPKRREETREHKPRRERDSDYHKSESITEKLHVKKRGQSNADGEEHTKKHDSDDSERKTFSKERFRERTTEKRFSDDKRFNTRDEQPLKRRKPYFDEEEINEEDEQFTRKKVFKESDFENKSSFQKKKTYSNPNEFRLNKYIANSGVCSRREADELIKAGKIEVNGVVVTDLGVKVHKKDVIKVSGKRVTPENKVYILLNKPKGYITTTKDPQMRQTVIDLVADATSERVYPVGRLDRNTTGVLLLTNDGELAGKLIHPRYRKRKVYQVELDKPLAKADADKIAAGIMLDSELVTVDALEYIDTANKASLGIEIHTGQNRVIRRIFESLGYDVTKLDRVYFAGLTKKGLTRGKWRFLTTQEINTLKMNNFS